MSQIVNGFLISVCVLIVWRQYKKEPVRGLCLAFFLLVSLPTTLSLSLLTELPTISVQRAILAALLFCTLTGASESRRLTQMNFGRILLWTAGLGLISTTLSPFLMVSVKQYLYFLIEVLGTFWIVRTTIKSADDGRKLVNWMGAGLAFVASEAIVERYTPLRVRDLLSSGVDERFFWALHSLDSTGTYAHRILLGLACSLGALIYLQGLISDDSKIRKGVLFLCGVLCLAALYFSMSRGPWLAFGAGCVALFMTMGARSMKWGLIFGLLVAVVLLIRPGVWLTISDLGSSTLDPTTLKGSSFQWRFVVINTALSEMNKAGILNMLFGFGGGSQLMTSFGKYEVAPGVWLPIESWDCEYAVALYDKGWLGLFFVLLLSVVGLIRIARLLRETTDSDTRSVSISVLIGLLLFAVARTNVSLYAPQLVYAEMAFFGIGSVLLDKTKVMNRKRVVFDRNG